MLCACRYFNIEAIVKEGRKGEVVGRGKWCEGRDGGVEGMVG